MRSIAITEMFSGRGTLTRALVDGLRQQLNVSVAAGIELDGRHLRCFSADHPEASTFLGDVTAYHPAELSAPAAGLRLFVAGIPCTGASLAGRAKNGGGPAEGHKEAGALFLPVIHYVRQHRPDFIILECVPQFRASYSARCLRHALSASAYEFNERIVNPYTDFETPTERKRWILIAARHGRFEWRYTPRPFTGTLESFLDRPSERDAKEAVSAVQVQRQSAYLARKLAQGCHFRLRLIDRNSPQCPVICATYGKRQPSAAYVRAGETYRPLRPREIARLHGFPRSFHIYGPRKLVYVALGQGVTYRPFWALGAALAAWIASAGQMEFPWLPNMERRQAGERASA